MADCLCYFLPSPIEGDWLDNTRSECDSFSQEFGYFQNDGSYNGRPALYNIPSNNKGEIKTLGLSHLELAGLHPFLPPEISLLTSLTKIRLKNNDIHAALPEFLPFELSQIPQLNCLFLRNNALNGTIPSELGLTSNLTRLDFDTNCLTGTIPGELGLMTDIEWLHLRSNAWSEGPLPSEFGLMTIV